MSYTSGPPLVRIIEGTWSGCQGPVVGIDQDRGTVTVQIRMPGIAFFPKRGRSVEIDVRLVRRLDR